MVRRVVIESTTPMIPTKSFSGKVSRNGRGRSQVGEAVGGVAAVVCCCPFVAINLAILAVYKVPSGLCKRAWNKKRMSQRRRLLKKKNGNSEFDGPCPIGLGIGLGSDDDDDGEESEDDEGDSMELENEKLEEEMWEQFYRGFWRSPSQKEDLD